MPARSTTRTSASAPRAGKVAFDASFLIDYHDGESAVGEFIKNHREQPLPCRHCSRCTATEPTATRPTAEGVSSALRMLSAWVHLLEFDSAGAGTAARVEADLLDASERVNLGDVVIAGICLQDGAYVGTDDDYFEREHTGDAERESGGS